VGDLETLEAVTALSLTTNDIKNLVDKLSTLSVMSLCPVVTSAGLTEDEVVGAEELTERTSADSIHGTRLQINEDSTGNILVTRGLVEVDVHALKLKIRGTIVESGAIETMLARDILPEGSTNLVTTLAGLEMNDFTHIE
jgi:hypothetical protein